jgi:hypothetical protein
MNRMHSAERELRLAMKLHRAPTAKKFMPKVQVKLSCTASLFYFLGCGIVGEVEYCYQFEHNDSS